MAEGLLRARFERRGRRSTPDRLRGSHAQGERRVESAGLAALVGRPADPAAVRLLADRGVDISGHRARQLTPDLLADFDLVLVMEVAQQHHLEMLSRASRGRVHRIGRFGRFDVPDPYRQDDAAFERALALIERGLDDFERLWGKA